MTVSCNTFAGGWGWGGSDGAQQQQHSNWGWGEAGGEWGEGGNTECWSVEGSTAGKDEVSIFSIETSVVSLRASSEYGWVYFNLFICLSPGAVEWESSCFAITIAPRTFNGDIRASAICHL